VNPLDVEYHREQQARKEDRRLEEWELLLEMIAVKETKATPYSSPTPTPSRHLT
jgi:hypothetical protein